MEEQIQNQVSLLIGKYGWLFIVGVVTLLFRSTIEKGVAGFMVFVNTSLDVAQKRNQERARSLPPKLLKKSWDDVQNNLGKFQGLFGRNFVVVDNSKHLKPKDALKKFGMLTKKYINKFVNKPIRNPKGKRWVQKQLILKNTKK